MQDQEKIASVYAQVLLELAQEDGAKAVEQIEAELKLYTQILRQEKRLWKFFHSPLTTQKSKQKAIQKALEGRVHHTLLIFLMVLIKRQRLDSLCLIQAAFSRAAMQFLKRLTVAAHSAYALSEDEERQLIHVLRAYFDKEIVLSRIIEPELIGGLMLSADHWRFDASLKTGLANIQQSLSQYGIRGKYYYEN